MNCRGTFYRRRRPGWSSLQFGHLDFLFRHRHLIGLDNADYNVQAALAGLGISGLALALAAQDTVSNMFGGITVLLQRPFKTGDRIQVNGIEGYVRQVGLRCSIIESLSGKRSYVPNKVFISETVVNQDTVRYYFQSDLLHLHRDMPKAQLEQTLDLLVQTAKANENVRWASAIPVF